MAEILVLGAGVAGLSAAWHARKAGREAVIFEAKERWGGLLDHFTVDGFRFDNGVHLAFGSSAEYRALLGKTAYITHTPNPYNYEDGRWIKHPVQNNLFPLPVEEKVEALISFIERPVDDRCPTNYREWLTQQFGRAIAERFPVRYTEKYWTVPAENMSTDWIADRLYKPSLAEVLYGAMSGNTPLTYYLQKMLYPADGGFRAFLDPLREGQDLRLGRQVTLVDPARKYVECADGSREYYQILASSIPLPELIRMIRDVPQKVKAAASTLWATSAALVSLGFDQPQAGDHLWFYIYDRHIYPARVHAPYRKAAGNAPAGKSSLQFEIYFSKHASLKQSDAELIDHVEQVVEKMKLAEKSRIIAADFRILPYANVVFDHGMTDRRQVVRDYIKGKGIISLGRFGLWDYLWSEQSFLSGREVEAALAML